MDEPYTETVGTAVGSKDTVGTELTRKLANILEASNSRSDDGDFGGIINVIPLSTHPTFKPIGVMTA
jgi:hypothetical protein